jgi:hypothetical protein
VRAAMMTLLLTGTALATPACQKKQVDQNIMIDNEVAANADIEALPPDESSETPSNELVNGADNPDVNSVTNNSD